MTDSNYTVMQEMTKFILQVVLPMAVRVLIILIYMMIINMLMPTAVNLDR